MVLRGSCWKPGWFLCLSFVLAFSVHADLIKRSSSGLCHPPESAWYDRTKNYEAYETLDLCLAEGGRLPSGVSVPGARAGGDADGYDRSEFGHGWDDKDGDCQDSRAEALIATSTTPVRFADDERCRVVSGRWISPFTGKVIQNASNIDIDHVVPLAWAWERGANEWSRSERERFANDRRNLWPVEASFSKDQYRIGKALLL